ncbi:MAG: CoA ester lyase [Alphaproteobacteria bacterium]|nr:CoA ester lyase [Alphaproteobacteria bacterium]
MEQPGRPRRSVLYMPGSNARALEKAKALPADALILDLEDAVAPDAKRTARAQVLEAAKSGAYGAREIVVRVNALDSPWGRDDIAKVASSGADALLLPKVESAAMVLEAEALMAENGAPQGLAIWCMMETPLGILQAKEIAGASPRLACLVMGTSDLAKDLHAHHTEQRLPMLTSLGLCLLAARVYGLAIVDGVHLDLEDETGLREVCRQGLELGFDGKTLIHPKQIAAANEIFAPDPTGIEEAKKIIAAHAEAEKAGKGVVLMGGRLIENLHVEDAHRLLALAKAIAEMEAA